MIGMVDEKNIEVILRALGKVEYRGSVTVSRDRSISAEVSKNVWIKDQMGITSTQRYADEDKEFPDLLQMKVTLGEELDDWEGQTKKKLGLTTAGNRSTKKESSEKGKGRGRKTPRRRRR